jgi:amidase
MNSVDLAFTSAIEQARLIRLGEVSPLELTELYLARIERLNPTLGSFFLVMADQAIAEAKQKTEELAGLEISMREELPPFFGVPIPIKDLTPVAGVPCSYGIRVLHKRVATEEAGIVTRIKRAGFTILGKTATSALGSTPYTEAKGFPPARNPWNINYTPGGSSGGAAAAVAAGLSAIAHGSDGGGSVRGPAACCGLVGIKPARGRVSHAPIGDKVSGLATDGTLARTVADAAALLDVMAGYEVGDPYWLPDPPDSFLSATQKDVTPLRIGFATEIPPVGKADPICANAVQDMAYLLEGLGHLVEPVEVDFTDLAEPLTTVWQASVDMGVPWLFLGKLNRWLLGRSRARSGGVYLRAVMLMQAIARRTVANLSHLDVLLLPVFMHPTIRVGEWARLRAAKEFEHIVNWVAPCPPFNATGQPGIAVPAGFDPNGLPIGVQLIGRPADETTLISLAAQIEQAKPWSHLRPAIAV